MEEAATHYPKREVHMELPPPLLQDSDKWMAWPSPLKQETWMGAATLSLSTLKMVDTCGVGRHPVSKTNTVHYVVV